LKNSLIILLITLAPALARAHTAQFCELTLAMPAPIPRTVMPLYPIEMEQAGQIFKPGETLPALVSGTYIFLTTDMGELLLAPKYNVQSLLLNEEKALATHKSLLALYRSRFGIDLSTHIVSAGEFVSAFGQAALVHNKSGNFRAGEYNLHYGVEILKSYGLPFNSKTKIVAYDPADSQLFGHTDGERTLDAFQLGILKQVYAHPDGPKLLALYEDLGRVAMSSGAPYADPGTAVVEAALKTKRLNGIMEFSYPLSNAATVDGMHFALYRVWENMKRGEPTLDFNSSGPYHVETFLNARSGQLSPEQVSELKRLAAGFKSLQGFTLD
jgi:hypothetical protein